MRGLRSGLVALTAMAPGMVCAHPGHGVTPPDSPAHYVLEPVHFLPVLLLAAACAGAWYALRALKRR